MGVAAELAAKHVDRFATAVAPLRDRLEAGLLDRVPNTSVNPPEAGRSSRVPNTTNISFRSLEAESILLLLSENGICCSAGAACQSGTLEPSHVLQAMGVEPKLAHGAVRFSLSRLTTAAEIEAALERIPPLIGRLAAMNRVVGETVSS
jgi:cysteine desulfurase